MAVVFSDRVAQTSTTIGTGTYDLDGSISSHRDFVASVGTGSQVHYVTTLGNDYEVGLGTITDAAPDTLSRDTIFVSSNADAAVSWAAGEKVIALTFDTNSYDELKTHVDLVNEHIDWTGATQNFSTTGTLASASQTITNSTTSDGLFINQDGNGISLDIDSEATTVPAVLINLPTVTTSNVLEIANANSLTNGRAALFHSNSADTGVRQVVRIHNNNALAIGATALGVVQDAAQTAVLIDQNANGNALVIDSESSSADIISINTPVITTGDGIAIVSCDSLTIGNIANFHSNSASTATRSLLRIRNDNTLATGATGVEIVQDAAQRALFIDQNGLGPAIEANLGILDTPFINFVATADGDTTSAISTHTTSGATTHHAQVNINGTKAWIAVSTNNPSA